MKYLSGLLVAVFVILSGTLSFAADKKDGAAVVTLYDDPQKTEYCTNDIYATNGYRTINCGGVETTMDNAKISSVFGDITIADTDRLILNNETPNRLTFFIRFRPATEEGTLVISGAFILKNKKSNKIIGDNSNIRYLYFNNDGTVELSNDNNKYKINNLIITTMDGSAVSIANNKNTPLYTIAIRKGQYELKTNIGLEEKIRCHFGLAGHK